MKTPIDPLPELPGDATEYRVVGPPGCGKTTWLGRQVELAVEKNKRVIVLSLTKAAAIEISGHALPIPPKSVGTLHSLCYHALQKPEIAQDKKYIALWNKEHPDYAMSHAAGEAMQSIDGDNLEPVYKTRGDRLLAQYQIHRARMDTKNMPDMAVKFSRMWELWKQENRLLDFTDLIEICLRDVPTAPGNPDLIFIDEAQDLDRLEMTLIRKWGKKAGYLVLVGDPDQSIYDWRGADPEVFINPPVPPEQKRVLAQSYRVPAAVHAKAVRWINQVQNREPVQYFPREDEGAVRGLSATYTHPEPAITDVEKYLAQGKSVMFLTSCEYMLSSLIAVLRKHGIPFHNPHRRGSSWWNPLQKRRNQASTADRVLAYLNLSENGVWTAQEVMWWTEMVKEEGILTEHGRKLVQELAQGINEDEPGRVSRDDLTQILEPDALAAALKGDLSWLSKQMPDAARKADVVYLFPNISKAARAELNGSSSHQAAVYRPFYVGMTRAREVLILCSEARGQKYSVNFSIVR